LLLCLTLRSGLVGAGTTIPTAISFNGTATSIVEIPALGCKGGWIAYGQGLAGKGGAVPRRVGSGCPSPGAAVKVDVDQVVGGTGGAIMVAVAPASIPLLGSTLLVAPGGPLVNVFPGGAPGLAGAGQAALPVTLPPDPGLSGVSFYLQAGFFDAAATQSISMSQGLEIELG
jgi:hypothetical protein